jgi:tetraacyldisaccharide 4'-kinase
MLYGLVVAIRNWLYDSDILKSKSFNIPIISVGNLAVGGTGKTPHTEFIISFLRNSYKVALLSRGYKRTTKGFRLADETSDSRIIGDEPFQMYRKFSDLTVAVDEKRVNGVTQLLEAVPDVAVIVLDDAFPHRARQPGISILLTEDSNLYSRDHLLPGGFLRENKKGSKRADIIVVTKCPPDLYAIDMRIIESELNIRTNQHLFFFECRL